MKAISYSNRHSTDKFFLADNFLDFYFGSLIYLLDSKPKFLFYKEISDCSTKPFCTFAEIVDASGAYFIEKLPENVDIIKYFNENALYFYEKISGKKLQKHPDIANLIDFEKLFLHLSYIYLFPFPEEKEYTFKKLYQTFGMTILKNL